MADTVDEVKARLSVVDVISPYVKLTKAGKYYKGLCPFHKEKSPSFMVSPDRGFYHCFGCGKGGDIFSFVEEMERVDFKGALVMLADKAGVEIVREEVGARSKKDAIFGALAAANEHFVGELTKNPDATAYLTSRGLHAKTIQDWSLGYAKASWQDLHEHLAKKGMTNALLEEAGLIKSESGRHYDRFRSRIMFPIRDRDGRVIAFTGRIFPNEDGVAKYLNSPETPVFEKSKILYGLDRAREGIRSLTFAILVEGQVDLLMAHQAGYVNTLALSGTAFTEDHAKLIKRHSDNLVIAFDGDRAGVAAAGRAALIALDQGLNVKIAACPAGEDPADLIHRDASLWKAAVRAAMHVVDFYLTYIRDAGYDPRRRALEVSRTVLPYVAAVKNEIDRAQFTKKIADEIGVPEEAVRAEVKKLVQQGGGVDVTTPSFEPFLSRGGTLERLLAGVRAAQGDDTQLKTLLPEDQRAALVEADLFLARFSTDEERAAAVADLESDLKKEMRRDKYRATMALLRSAEHEHDERRVSTLMTELAELAKTL